LKLLLFYFQNKIVNIDEDRVKLQVYMLMVIVIYRWKPSKIHSSKY